MSGDVSTVGRYAVVGRLARGGMGIVYRVRLDGEGGFVRYFALKKLHDHLAEDRETVQMFLDEARLAALIRHPNVVATTDVGREDGSFYVVMELVEGPSAAELIATRQCAPRTIAVRIILDVLDGLSAAHCAVDDTGQLLEIVHRDVSPANILVGKDGVTKLTDFGIAKARARLRTTVGVEVKGKIAYMPPEQLEGNVVDLRADLFAAGVVLWELLTGQSMLKGKRGRLKELCEQRRPAWFSTGAGTKIDDVIHRALALAPSERFPDARSMASALRGAAADGVASREEVSAWIADFMRSRDDEVSRHRRGSGKDTGPSSPEWGAASSQRRSPPFEGASATQRDELITANVAPEAAWVQAAPGHPRTQTKRLPLQPTYPSIPDAGGTISFRSGRGLAVALGVTVLFLATLGVATSRGVKAQGSTAAPHPSDVAEHPVVSSARAGAKSARSDVALSETVGASSSGAEVGDDVEKKQAREVLDASTTPPPRVRARGVRKVRSVAPKTPSTSESVDHFGGRH